MPNARQTVIITFILMATIFCATTIYSGYAYFQIYHAVRTFSVAIQSFSFNIVDSIMTTEIRIENPSEVSFEILIVEERVEAGY